MQNLQIWHLITIILNKKFRYKNFERKLNFYIFQNPKKLNSTKIELYNVIQV